MDIAIVDIFLTIFIMPTYTIYLLMVLINSFYFNEPLTDIFTYINKIKNSFYHHEQFEHHPNKRCMENKNNIVYLDNFVFPILSNGY